MPSGRAGAIEGFARAHAASPGFSWSLGGAGGEGASGTPQPWPRAPVGSSRAARGSVPPGCGSADAGARRPAAPPGAPSRAGAPGPRGAQEAVACPPGAFGAAGGAARRATNLLLGVVVWSPRLWTLWGVGAGGVGSWRVRGGRRRDPARGSLPGAAPLLLPALPSPHRVSASFPSARSESAGRLGLAIAAK